MDFGGRIDCGAHLDRTGFGGGRRGVFYSREDFGGRPVLVRFVIESTGSDTCRFEQAFSPDGGTTWETNWIAVDTFRDGFVVRMQIFSDRAEALEAAGLSE